jgi:hypothetical protein
VAKLAEIVPLGGDCGATSHRETTGGFEGEVAVGVVVVVGVPLAFGVGLLLHPVSVNSRTIIPTSGRRLTLPL